jgi:hypothetical protein
MDKQLNEDDLFMDLADFGIFAERYDNLNFFKTSNDETEKYMMNNKHKILAEYIKKLSSVEQKKHEYSLIKTTTTKSNSSDETLKLVVKLKKE